MPCPTILRVRLVRVRQYDDKRIMVRYEQLLLKARSALCLVVGDVTSTMACAIAAHKLRVPVASRAASVRATGACQRKSTGWSPTPSPTPSPTGSSPPARSPTSNCARPAWPNLEFNYLVKHARGVITDSGGVSEETTVMGVPCVTLRDTTERPETVTIGTNELIDTDPVAWKPTLYRLFAGGGRRVAFPRNGTEGPGRGSPRCWSGC